MREKGPASPSSRKVAIPPGWQQFLFDFWFARLIRCWHRVLHFSSHLGSANLPWSLGAALGRFDILLSKQCGSPCVDGLWSSIKRANAG